MLEDAKRFPRASGDRPIESLIAQIEDEVPPRERG